MSVVNNNQFEVKPNPKSKRKITSPCSTAYHNPALDLLVNEDPMCNTAMEVLPMKKRKRSKSCDIAAFENVCIDTGISKAAVNQFLVRELENVRKTMRQHNTVTTKEMITYTENSYSSEADKENVISSNASPIYSNVSKVNSLNDFTDITLNIEKSYMSMSNTQQCIDLNRFEPNISAIEMDSGKSVLEQNAFTATTDSLIDPDPVDSSVNTLNVQKNITNQILINNTSNVNLSFIDRLALDSPNLSNQSLYFDDDLNESNIMEIKTITIITKKKKVIDKKRNTNPFLDPNLNENYSEHVENPFLNVNETKPELEYNDVAMTGHSIVPHGSNMMPRRLFTGDTNSTISTVNDSINPDNHEYENIDNYRSESPIYENISGEMNEIYNKQSKILGHDVSRFSAIDIMNLNKQTETDTSNESNNSKKDLKHQILKASNKLSKKVFKTLKRTFKHDKVENNVTLNPYEVPRKPPKQKTAPKDSGIENPALNLDNSDEIEIEEIEDEEHQYETVKTIRNTQLNMNVTPLRERVVDNDVSQSKPYTPGKKVRFDSTLNQEKVITGNSFDYDIQSPGIDAKLDKFHDELENCINERKFIQQNM